MIKDKITAELKAGLLIKKHLLRFNEEIYDKIEYYKVIIW